MKKCSTGKVKHNSRRDAILALKNINNAGLKLYECVKCKGWHLANSKSNFKVQARIDQLLSM